MIVGTVMDQIGSRLDTIDGLRVHAYEKDEIQVPAGLVSLPGMINYQTTFGPGYCQLTIEVTILVSKVDDKIRRDKIAPYADSRGSRSVRAVLEGGTYTAFDSLEVRTGRFLVVNIAGDDYLAFVVAIDIIGQTST
jgi:hypothetical protein